MIERTGCLLSLRHQCALLEVNLSTLYYQKALVNDTIFANEIHDIWMEMPFYGSRRITAELNRCGTSINRKKVQRIMKEMKIQALYPVPKTSVANPKAGKYPYLLVGLIISRPNQVWATDITYIRIPSGFVYLMALIDIYSRKILSWTVSTSMETFFCLSMLKDALEKYGSPSIVNTDQGSQFTSHEWIKAVESAGSKVSQDGKGRWADNIYIERFWRTAKYEHVFLYVFETVQEIRKSIGDYILLYNGKRLHQKLGYNTPNEVYHGKVKSNPVELWKTLSGLHTVPQAQQQSIT
jgi:putative transposase